MKIIKYIILGSLLLLVLAAAAGFWYFKHTAPDYSGTVSSKVITEGAEVTFDSLGIPHILAKTSGDAYFALGYIHASERLFQMELLRRVGSGRLAEILGKDLVSVDKFFRTLGIRNTAKAAAASWQKSNETWIPLCKKYLEGINYFMDTQPMPAEFTLLGIEKQHFKAEDIYLITGYMAFSFAEGLKTDPLLSKIALMENGAYLPFSHSDSITANNAATASMLPLHTDNLFNLLPVSPWTGSNAWVIAGNKSKSGKPILANDTHIGYQQPAVWYEAELKCPDHHIYGHYLAGIPFPLTGHTPEHAWGLTMFENDDLNLYTEEVKDNRYRNGSDWYDVSVTTDTIQIKDTLPEIFKIKSTHRGPLVSNIIPHLTDSASQEYSVWWSYTKLPANAPSALFQYINSKTLAQARQAAATVNAPGLNIIYANRNGDIACWSAGKIPVFPRKTDTRFILCGESGTEDPFGFLDFSKNPQTENPASGIIISANQPPDKLIGDSLPVYGYYAPNDRYHRLTKLLESDKKWSMYDFTSIQTDATSDEQASLAKFVFEHIQSSTNGDIINMMKRWTGEHRIEDTAPSVWYTTLSYILKNTMEDELGPFDYSVFVNTHINKTYMGSMIRNKDSKWWNNIHTEAIETRDQIFTESFVEAVQFLQAQFGNDPGSWQWGKLHILTHNHPAGAVKPLNLIFNVGPLPAPGGIETINNASFSFTAGEPFKIKYGAAMRNIIDLADPASALSILTTGQSGHAASDHYDDQSLSYVTGAYRPMLMRPAFDPGSSEKTILFTPGN